MPLGLSMDLVLGVIAIVGFVWLLVTYVPFIRKQYAVYKVGENFPNLPKHFLWGTFPTLRDLGRENISQYLLDQTKSHGPVLVFWRSAFVPELYVTNSKVVGQVLRTSEPKTLRFKTLYSLSKPWLGEGLLISGGKKWERNRKLLTPAFHFSVLQPYVQVYNDAVDVLLSKLRDVAQTETSYEVFDPVSLCTLDIMLRCAFSYEGSVQERGELHPYVHSVKRLGHLIGTRSLNPAMYIDWLYYLTKNGREFKQQCDYVHRFAEEIIEARQRKLETDPDVIKRRHLDFLDILLAARDESGVGLSKEDMRAEVDTFLFEGHDTTASAISWSLHCLAKYQDVQDKVYQEVHEVLGSRTSVEWTDLPKLTYTMCFVREVMRMYTPVPMVGRELTKPMVIEGKEVPAGTTINMSLRTVHKNPDVWENPEEFLPERFLDEKYSSRDPYSFVPFSAGPRNCIGQMFAQNEEKVVVARIVNSFRIGLDENHDTLIFPTLVTKAKTGIKLKFFPRD